MEILFAVMILGVGFIMVAAMFPAALRQTQANVEVTAFNTVVAKAQNDLLAAAAMYDPSANYVFQQGTLTTKPQRFLDLLTGWIANDQQSSPGEPYNYDPSNPFLPTASIGRPYPISFHDPRLAPKGRFNPYLPTKSAGPKGTYTNIDVRNYLWDMVRGNLIMPDKREYAYVPLWSRGLTMARATFGTVAPTPDASLNLFIFPVRSRAKPAYDPFMMTQGLTQQVNAACDVAFDYTNLDPQLIEINYFPPPATNANPDLPYGVLKVNALDNGAGDLRTVYPQPPATEQVNPCCEGAYVVLSDSQAVILGSATNPYPRALNGMIFKLGQEVSGQSGTPGTSAGQYWAVAEIDNMPSEQPFNITKASQIGPTDMSSQDQIYALVIGRQPDPADAMQHNPASNRQGSPRQLLNRTGPTQALGVILTSVPLK